MSKIDIMSIDDLLSMNLSIPNYQRPYKWSVRNVDELISDINTAIEDSKKYHSEYKYRIGTILLHKTSSDDGMTYEIVDGQQRIISLILLKLRLDPSFRCSVMEKGFSSRVAQENVYNNYNYIREWFSLKPDSVAEEFRAALSGVLEVVVIQVDKVSEAFQLFDSQNTRGRELDPHDLLKAYHLREMKGYPYEMEHAVTKWEAKNTSKIRDLFSLYLFPIWNWSRGSKSWTFTSKDIDTYKGIQENSGYTYARRAGRATPFFQITEPFVAGNDFFEMVDHYLNLKEDVESEINHNKEFEDIRSILGPEKDGSSRSTGFRYAKNLFECALIDYYDKFHNFDVMAVKKLFTWAFMIRVDMQNLGFDSINKYAIGGEDNYQYTNRIPIFALIEKARVHTEISRITVRVKRDNDTPASPKWEKLYVDLKKMNGFTEAADE